jgi:AraC-like DNA-binding protein
MDNVLLLVFDGVLRFSENGKQIEVKKGEYYIQKKNCYQGGEICSDSPKYLYVHFDGEWSNGNNVLPFKGVFDIDVLYDYMKKLDLISHAKGPYLECLCLLLNVLILLKNKYEVPTIAKKIATYIEDNFKNINSLNDLCKKFNYSKNYLIRLFNKEFGVTPNKYINDVKIKRAIYLLETTSKSINEISIQCGYNDYPYFYKRFYLKVGVSPQVFRNNVRQNPSLRF